MRVGPCPADTGLRYQRHRERRCGLHYLASELGQRRCLILRRFEQQLIVDLQQQARPKPRGGECRGQPHHRALDDVRRSPLQRRIDRLTFGLGAVRRVLVGNARHPAAPAEWAGDIALFPRLLLRALHVGANARIPLKIPVDIDARLAGSDAKLTR